MFQRFRVDNKYMNTGSLDGFLLTYSSTSISDSPIRKEDTYFPRNQSPPPPLRLLETVTRNIQRRSRAIRILAMTMSARTGMVDRHRQSRVQRVSPPAQVLE